MLGAATGSPGIQIQTGLPGFRVPAPARGDGGMPAPAPLILRSSPSVDPMLQDRNRQPIRWISPAVRISAGRSSIWMTSSTPRAKARSITFSSWMTLPGQW